MSDASPQAGFEDLEISCTKTICNKDLHFYQPKRRSDGKSGPCRTCGAKLVEWNCVHQRDPANIDYLLACMATEWIRHHYWCDTSYDKEALVPPRVLGRRQFNIWVPKHLASVIGRPADAFDGRRTPYEGHVIYYAQHATATCCRVCVEEWHGIPPNRALTDHEMRYMLLLVNRYFERFPIPGLTEEGENRKAVRQSLGLPPTTPKKKKVKRKAVLA